MYSAGGRLSSGISGEALASFFKLESLCIFAETDRPAERPMVVLEALIAAAWRIDEGFVAGGACLREEMLENGRRVFAGG